MPAQAIEGVVIDRLQELLRTPGELLNLVTRNNASAREQQELMESGRALADGWAQLKRPEQLALLRRVIRRITVTRHRVHIAFSPVGLKATLMRSNNYPAPQQSAVEAEYQISLPVSLRRCGIESRLVVPNGDNGPAHHASTRAIQEALAKALTWNDELMSGKVSSMNQLAKRESVTQRYIAHLLKLAYLAPNIMQAIAHGDIPSAVSLGRLKKGFPLDWEEQRKVLGFPA